MQQIEIGLNQQLAALKQHPLLASWPIDALHELVKHLTAYVIAPGEKIVEQGKLVDSVYFIFSGKAEVFYINADGTTLLVTLLSTGEAIGLTEKGFFSKTGARTATVTGASSHADTIVLKLSLDELHEVLLQFPQLNDELKSVNLKLLKLQLIKQAAPFTTLAIDKLNQLADKIEEKEISANTILFNQNDEGDYCYLIRSGSIGIDKTASDNHVQRIATLTSPAIFGETALLLSAPRNASAIALTDCQLLALSKDIVLNLVNEEKSFAEHVTILMLERAAPRHNPNVVAYERQTADGQEIIILKNIENNEYYQLAEESIVIWRLLNGDHSIREIIQLANQKFGSVTAAHLKDLFIGLAEGHFILVEGLRSPDEIAQFTPLERLIDQVKQILEINYVFKNVDAWLTKTYNAGIKYLFKTPAQIIFACLTIIGLLVFIILMPKIFNQLSTQPNILGIFAIAYLIGITSAIPHELGHAYATKSYGRSVTYFGVGWYWVGPVAFTDTTDMCLCPPKQRIVVDLAGIYTHFIFGGFFAVIAWMLPYPTVSFFFWLLALANYWSIYQNLDPLLEFDGYYVLMDVLDHPDLREDALIWLVHTLPKNYKQPKLFLDNWHEIVYWLSCIFFIFIRVGVTFLIQELIITPYTGSYNHMNWHWIIPTFVMLLSFLSVWVNAKKRLRQMN